MCWPATHDRLGKEVGKVTDGAAQTQCMTVHEVLNGAISRASCAARDGRYSAVSELA